jgi:oxygen-independent coproporphyrinogen-3 oxidase
MIALPGQGSEDLRRDLEEACRLDPEHLSTYCLTFEEDTALWVKLSQGKIKQDIEKDADLYELTWEHLTNSGYQHYEISNFSKPGRECVHNINTWKMKEWIGVGPSAASQYHNIRYSNAADLDAWLDQTETAPSERCEVQMLTEADLLEDSVIFGLRMGQGVSMMELQQRFPFVPLDALSSFFDSLESEALVSVEGHDLAKLTLNGKLLADKIAVEFLELALGKSKW